MFNDKKRKILLRHGFMSVNISDIIISVIHVLFRLQSLRDSAFLKTTILYKPLFFLNKTFMLQIISVLYRT